MGLIHMDRSSTLWIFVASRISLFMPSPRGDLPCVVPSRGAISVRDVGSADREEMSGRTHSFLQS